MVNFGSEMAVGTTVKLPGGVSVSVGIGKPTFAADVDWANLFTFPYSIYTKDNVGEAALNPLLAGTKGTFSTQPSIPSGVVQAPSENIFNIGYYDKYGKPRVFAFTLLPAMQHATQAGGGTQPPEMRTGINITYTMRHRNIPIPGSTPVLQSLGVDKAEIHLCGLLTGWEQQEFPGTLSLPETYGGLAGTATKELIKAPEVVRRTTLLDIQLDNEFDDRTHANVAKAGQTYVGAQSGYAKSTHFFNELVQSSIPVTLSVIASSGFYHVDGVQMVLNDHKITMEGRMIIRNYRTYNARFNRTYYVIDAYLVDYKFDDRADPQSSEGKARREMFNARKAQREALNEQSKAIDNQTAVTGPNDQGQTKPSPITVLNSSGKVYEFKEEKLMLTPVPYKEDGVDKSGIITIPKGSTVSYDKFWGTVTVTKPDSSTVKFNIKDAYFAVEPTYGSQHPNATFMSKILQSDESTNKADSVTTTLSTDIIISGDEGYWIDKTP